MKIIVFDDDPTGSQTVKGCLLLLKWDYHTLLKGLRSKSNLLFILANTRSLSENEAKARLKEICQSLLYVFVHEGYKKEDFIFVSRGDSTLRGHNFIEPDVINNELGPFDATFHIPAFLEGNRVTVNGRHFVDNIPAHQTIFAKDKIFGYETNDIRKVLYKKSNSKIQLKDIKNLFISDLRNLEMSKANKVFENIFSLKNNVQIIVDAEEYSHLNKISNLVKELRLRKRFLFRTAASFLSSISNTNGSIKDHKYSSNLKRKNRKDELMNGLIVVGSFLQNANDQLKQILGNSLCKGIELNVFEFVRLIYLDENKKGLLKLKLSLLDQIRNHLKNSYTPVLYTSRELVLLKKDSDQIFLYNSLSKFIAELIGEISFEIGYLISKGGITSNTILSHGLDVDAVYLEGQILKGISLVKAKIKKSDEEIAMVTFPGNIGNRNSLLKAWEILEGKHSSN